MSCLLGAVSTLLGPMPAASAGPPDKPAVTRGYLYDNRPMTKWLSVPFDAGRPRLDVAEEREIARQALLPARQTALREPATILVVIGYVDGHGDTEDNQRVALRRAQLVIVLLHDKCQFAGSSQATTMLVGDLPAKDRANKNAVAEIWLVNP